MAGGEFLFGTVSIYMATIIPCNEYPCQGVSGEQSIILKINTWVHKSRRNCKIIVAYQEIRCDLAGKQGGNFSLKNVLTLRCVFM